MTRIGFAEGYYDSFTGAQQSMAMLMKNSNSLDPILITPGHGKCVESISDQTADKQVIDYPSYLDVFGGELLTGGIAHKMSVTANVSWYYLKVMRAFLQLDLDVLCCNNIRSLFLFGPPAKILNIPLLWYVRIDTPIPRLDSFALRLADKVITISNGVRQRFDKTLLQKYEEDIQTIYTGVDLKRFDPDKSYGNPYNLDPDLFTIVEIASIQPRKRQDKVIEAVSQVQQELPEFRLIFAGSAAEGEMAYFEQLQDQAQERDLEEKVTFLGWCDNIPAILSKADIFVLPSENEGFPRSILEASAMETPTIATPAGGTTELVRNKQTGIIIPPNNIGKLSSAIRELAQSQKLRNCYGKNARKLVEEKFTKQEYIRNFEKLIHEMLSL